MDQRSTFVDLPHMLSLLKSLLEQKESAALIIDKEGLERMQGVVTGVDESNNIAETVIHIHPTNKFRLDQVIAINGIFRSDYSEC